MHGVRYPKRWDWRMTHIPQKNRVNISDAQRGKALENLV